MLAYNAEKYIKQAIDSILNQTFSDFEFIIYNDGSVDGTDDVIRTFKDKRIRYESMQQNVGYVNLRNKGLKDSRGKYIAWMDADDISMPKRIEEQYLFLEDNPGIGICGSWYENFGNLSGIYECPTSPEEIRYSLFFGTPFGNPTVMMKRDLLDKYSLKYDKEFSATEDYDLFERASLYFDLANIPKVLLKYRKHSAQITSTNWQEQYNTVGKIQARRLLRGLNDCEEKDKMWLENYFSETSLVSKKWICEINLYKERLIAENKCNQVYPEQIFVKAVNNLFTEEKSKKNIYNYCFRKFYNQQRFNLPLLNSFFIDENRPYKWLGSKLTFLFIIKCLLNYRKKGVLPI